MGNETIRKGQIMNERKRGRPQRYLTIEAFNEFLNNHFFHLKVELRVQSFVVGIILALIVAMAIRLFSG